MFVCTNGTLVGDDESISIEAQRDVRFILFLSDKICATPVGIPINLRYYVLEKEDGQGGAVFSECGSGSTTDYGYFAP